MFSVCVNWLHCISQPVDRIEEFGCNIGWLVVAKPQLTSNLSVVILAVSSISRSYTQVIEFRWCAKNPE